MSWRHHPPTYTWADYLTAWADYLNNDQITLELSHTDEALTLDLNHPRHIGPITRWLLDDPPPGPTPGGHR